MPVTRRSPDRRLVLGRRPVVALGHWVDDQADEADDTVTRTEDDDRDEEVIEDAR